MVPTSWGLTTGLNALEKRTNWESNRDFQVIQYVAKLLHRLSRPGYTHLSYLVLRDYTQLRTEADMK
jgi:hypothetical protein